MALAMAVMEKKMKRFGQTMGPVLFVATLLQGCIVLPWGTEVTRDVYGKQGPACVYGRCTNPTKPPPSTEPAPTIEPAPTTEPTPHTDPSQTNPPTTEPAPTTEPQPAPKPAASVTLQRLVVEELSGNGTPDEMHYLQKEMNGLIESFHTCDISRDEFPVGETTVRFRLAIGVGPDGRFQDAEETVMLSTYGKTLGLCVREQLLSSQVSLPPRSYVSLKLQVRAIVQGR